MGSSITNLPTPTFINDGIGTDPNVILAAMISEFESSSGRTLYPAQVERLLINLYAYRESLTRTQIEAVAKSLLLVYAVYPIIDYLGLLVGVSRLAAQPSTVPLEFTLIRALTVSLTIPSGTQVGTSDGSYIFALTEDLIIAAGTTTGTATGTCTTAGTGGNGYVAGQIATLINANSLVSSVANTATSSGGTVTETDDHLRSRIQMAPSQFSVAGPEAAYRALAFGASSSVSDVSVDTPQPGTVQLYVLCGPITTQPAPSPNAAGIPSSALLAEVLAACSAVTARPLCDTVLASAVTEVDYTIAATLTLYADASASSSESAAQDAAEALALTLANAVGADLVPSQWNGALQVSGVYEVSTLVISASVNGIALGAQSDGRVILSAAQWANCTAINLSFAIGTEETPS